MKLGNARPMRLFSAAYDQVGEMTGTARHAKMRDSSKPCRPLKAGLSSRISETGPVCRHFTVQEG